MASGPSPESSPRRRSYLATTKPRPLPTFMGAASLLPALPPSISVGAWTQTALAPAAPGPPSGKGASASLIAELSQAGDLRSKQQEGAAQEPGHTTAEKDSAARRPGLPLGPLMRTMRKASKPPVPGQRPMLPIERVQIGGSSSSESLRTAGKRIGGTEPSLPRAESFKSLSAQAGSQGTHRPRTGGTPRNCSGPSATRASSCSRSSACLKSPKARSEERTLHCGWLPSLCDTSGESREGKSRMRLLKSVFEGRPPVLFFDYDPRCGAASRDAQRVLSDGEMEAEELLPLPTMYWSIRTTKDVHEYNCVVNTLRLGGLTRTAPTTTKWTLYWGPHPETALLKGMGPFQKANHFPASWHLGRKDLLQRNVAKMKRQFPKDFDIMPHGFVLPDGFQAWAVARESAPSALWIWKPCNLSCGRGIRIFGASIPPNVEKKLAQKSGVVQRYLHRPLLINGFKFDLRLYVVITSFDPLKIYLNSEGLVRLATSPYSDSPESLSCRTMHLTNYSVNKHAVAYAPNLDSRGSGAGAGPVDGEDDHGDGEGTEDEELEADSRNEQRENRPNENGASPSASPGQGAGTASKWSLGELQEYLSKVGLSYEQMMKRIEDLIIKTILAVEPPIMNAWHQGANFAAVAPSIQAGPNQTCFEILGFDVMVDEDLKPWLLEVNTFPSLSSSSPYDKRVKTQLIADTLTLVGFLPFDHELIERLTKEEQARRLQGLQRSCKLLSVTRSHTVQSVGSVASLKEFGEAEWGAILDAHDENMRQGHLKRIYPVAEGLEYYSQFFAAPRYLNAVLAKWLQLGGERVFLPEHSKEVPPWLPKLRASGPC